MDAEAIIDRFRHRVDDRVEEYRTTDEDAMRFLTEAETEAAIRASLLFDDETASITTITVVADEHTYALDPRVWRLVGASFTPSDGGRARELDLKGMDYLRDQCDWRTRTGRPRLLVHQDRAVRLWPIPATGGTLQLQLYRKPLEPIEDLQDEPEIPEEHHEGLVDWLIYRALDTKDGEDGDRKAADRALADFTDRFGERPTADVMRMQRERRRTTTRCL